MDKPLILIQEEGRENIIKAINEANLPPFLLEPILKDLYNEVAKLRQSEYEKTKRKYEQNKNKKEEKVDG